MSDRQSDGNSSSSESAESGRDPFDEPIEDINRIDTSPRNFSDEEPSPSQYQAEKLLEEEAHGSDEEQPPEMSNSDAEEVMQRQVDPGLLVKSKRTMKPVRAINPGPQPRRPTAATLAAKRVRFQVSARTVMTLTHC